MSHHAPAETTSKTSSPADTATSAGSHAPESPRPSRQPWRETALGDDDRRGVGRNVSWGSIIAGVVTFLAVSILLSLVTAAVGLGMLGGTGDGVGVATGIAAIVTLALATAAGGYVAGLLSGRAGLIHGFLTWATALLSAVVLSSVLVGGVLGTAGTLLGSAAASTVGVAAENPGQVGAAVEGITPEGSDQSGEQVAQDVAAQSDQAADAAAGGTMWTFAGLLIGAVIASVMGMLGSRSVHHERSDGRADDRDRRAARR